MTPLAVQCCGATRAGHSCIFLLHVFLPFGAAILPQASKICDHARRSSLTSMLIAPDDLQAPEKTLPYTVLTPQRKPKPLNAASNILKDVAFGVALSERAPTCRAMR